ncbi:hypothetical protein [Massilia sp. ST3]|uniref:hypothetical protein n=1 Tax=Massilia sp. ST3 TaxID=2824903 RepID=UPI001B83570A|nr:hypothetical protein [Massilia sp. ST3]MBQ5946642.1 hypothetical protein [Massilia sp. ST3]
MQELNTNEIEMASGGKLSWDEGATLILALGAMGGPATFAFGFPIAAAMFYLS